MRQERGDVMIPPPSQRKERWSKIIEKENKRISPETDERIFHVHAGVFDGEAGPIAEVMNIQKSGGQKRNGRGEQKKRKQRRRHFFRRTGEGAGSSGRAQGKSKGRLLALAPVNRAAARME